MKKVLIEFFMRACIDDRIKKWCEWKIRAQNGPTSRRRETEEKFPKRAQIYVNNIAVLRLQSVFGAREMRKHFIEIRYRRARDLPAEVQAKLAGTAAPQ